MVQTCGALEPQATSIPWQVVKPQVDEPEVTTVTIVKGMVWVGIAVTLPDEGEVHPAATRDAASRTRHIPVRKAGYLIVGFISSDIHPICYLLVYLTAKIPGPIYWGAGRYPGITGNRKNTTGVKEGSLLIHAIFQHSQMITGNVPRDHAAPASGHFSGSSRYQLHPVFFLSV
jgi:hypothetical protein